MSEYQRQKARALELQQKKEEQLKRDLAAKAEREKAAAKAEEERRKRIEEAGKAARRMELMKANSALTQSSNNAASAFDYNPFAEDAPPPPPPKAAKPLPKPSASASRAALVGSSRPSGSGSGSRSTGGGGSSSGSRARKGSPPALGRKEKAALKLQRQSKQTVEDSLFSVRALVDQAEGRSHSSSPAPRRAPPVQRRASSAGVGTSRNVSSTSSAAGPKGISAMKKSMDVSGLRKLCPDRATRDRRTIDEIQRDIRARRGEGSAPAPAPSGSRNTAAPSARDRGALDRDRDRDRDRARSRDRDRDVRPPPKAAAAGASKARRKSSYSDDYDSEDSYDSPPRKKRRDAVEEPSRHAVSAMIQNIFSRPGRGPRQYHDDSDSDDMEAGLDDVEAEERRALKLAKLEDQKEEALEAQRRAEKERRAREREREKERLMRAR